MEGKTIGVIVIVIVVVIGGWYLLRANPAAAPTGGEATNQMPVPGSETDEMVVEDSATSVTVRYGDTGFSPASVTIPMGGTVTFVNESSSKMWVASAMHPDHTAYSGTSLSQHCPDTTKTAFDQCASGERGATYSFTFTKTGTWKYHNHVDATKFGSVVVTP